MTIPSRFAVRLCSAILVGWCASAASVIRADEPWLYVGADEGPASVKIAAALDEKTRMEFIETPLSDVVAFLKDLHDIPIQFDTAALKAGGIQSDAPVTLDLKDVSLRSALRLMLGTLKLTYTIRHEVLLITTPVALAATTDVRVYNAGEILNDGQTTADLADLLTELFAAGAANRPAEPKPRFLPYGRFLIVRDTTEGHDEVAKFLRTMRTAVNGGERVVPDSPEAAEEKEGGESGFRRDPTTRQSRLRAHGGTEDGERAVAAGLKWLAAHQSPDGSWSFNHAASPCQGRCKNSGELAGAQIAATSLALLPFLGAGQTHSEGQYKATVARGLHFLVRSIKISAAGADLTEPGGLMYSHGLATLVLCEGYGLTRDRALLPAAQGALDYIAHAQDPQGGGWRYMPRQPGDTSVSGWQILALRAGQRAGLEVAEATLLAASRFLDGVQANDGAAYGYVTPGIRQTTSAIGLLCRTYEGWDGEHEALARGVKNIAKRQSGSSVSNHYFSFFANECLFRATGGAGEVWQSWQPRLRERLIRSQATRDHESGSWHLAGDIGAERGGRLYCTALALLCLEVYYR